MIIDATVVNELEKCLAEGWIRFNASEDHSVFSEAFEFFKRVGLYEGLFRPHIPNPAYDNGAKNIGREFLARSASLGLYYAELFPGDFAESIEAAASSYKP